MGASTRRSHARLVTGLLFLTTLLDLSPHPAVGQVPAEPVLNGRVTVNGSPGDAGTVVLHYVSQRQQGEVDSVATASDGSFTIRLPSVPNSQEGDVYFASVRYAGILYFGDAITLPMQLDSLYEIQVFDTLYAPEAGAALPIQVRNTFLEPSEDGWQVTDLLQVRNDGDRTLVAREGGAVWRYPLAVGSRDHDIGQGAAQGAVDFQGEDMVVRTPLAPGEALFVVRYVVDDPFIELPMPGVTEAMELLVREPAPPLVTGTLSAVESVELEPGTTYRRFMGTNLSDTRVRFEEGVAQRRLPVEWIAVFLALVLAGFGVMAATRSVPGSDPSPTSTPDTRESLILEVARMDEAHAGLAEPSEGERQAYERRRRELLARLARLG